MKFIALSGTVLWISSVMGMLYAQQPQIPTLQVCNLTPNMVVASNPPATVTIVSRMPGGFAGSFTVTVKVTCDPSGYPTGTLIISGISMSDSAVMGTITATTFDQLTSTGHDTPTAYMSGRCVTQGTTVGVPTGQPCKYWIMFADNSRPSSLIPTQGTPDIISFLVFDKSGKRIAYGTGPVVNGNIDITQTTF